MIIVNLPFTGKSRITYFHRQLIETLTDKLKNVLLVQSYNEYLATDL